MPRRDGRPVDNDDDAADDRTTLLTTDAAAPADSATHLIPSAGALRGYGAIILVSSQDSRSTSAGRPTRVEEEEEGLARRGRQGIGGEDAANNEAVLDDDVLDDDDQLGKSMAPMSRPTRHLAIAYAGLLLLAFTTSLEGQVTAPLAAFAVSSFNNHSLLSTVYVVQGVVNGELLVDYM